ncbi:uncharacterized protein LOC117332530 [Pecten maximus]|uniref:uncharacterized protein LOC117332530 n=1 Tax=Pecten maximus TaxID=6579 RepID=UPI00145889E6|nr:uncharacterized protein LOC117332530 [Pecten maximus]
MSTNLRKSFRLSWLPGKKYNVLEGKENMYFNTPKYKRAISEGDIPTQRHAIHPIRNRGNQKPKFERNSTLTKSVREAVGSLKQKFRVSTRKLKRLTNDTKSPSPTKGVRHGNRTSGRTPPRPVHHDVKMYSPFLIDTPSTSRTPTRLRTSTSTRWTDNMETPTRLRREVEALTSNMQALATLTPGGLQQRPKTRRSTISPLTNGSLRTRPTGERSSERLQTKQQRIRTSALVY